MSAGHGVGRPQGPAPDPSFERTVRRLMDRSSEHVGEVPDLMARAHTRAGRIRRRRRAGAVAGLAFALVTLAGVGTWLRPGNDPKGSVTVQPAGPTISSSAATTSATTSATSGTDATSGATTSTGASTSISTTSGAATRTAVTSTAAEGTAAKGTASERPTARGRGGSASAAPSARPRTTAPAGTSADPLRPAGPWTTAQVDDRFSATSHDLTRWAPYTGTSGSPETTWSPQQVTVADGSLLVRVDRTGDTTPTVVGGGVHLNGSGQRYGRWEVRMRMTAAPGVTGQFVLLGDGPGGVGQIATLAPAERRLTVADEVRGTSVDVTLDGTAFHVLAVESTPQRVRWFVDGRVVVDESGGAPRVPVVGAVQALVQDVDCGRTPLPAGCSGPATYPQRLEVDYVRTWAYQA